MTTIYVASFCTTASVETLREDCREYDATDFATGMTCAAGTDRDRVIEKAKAACIEEMIDEEDLRAHSAIPEVADYADKRIAEIRAIDWVQSAEDVIMGSIGVADVDAVIVIRTFED